VLNHTHSTPASSGTCSTTKARAKAGGCRGRSLRAPPLLFLFLLLLRAPLLSKLLVEVETSSRFLSEIAPPSLLAAAATSRTAAGTLMLAAAAAAAASSASGVRVCWTPAKVIVNIHWRVEMAAVLVRQRGALLVLLSLLMLVTSCGIDRPPAAGRGVRGFARGGIGRRPLLRSLPPRLLLPLRV
jgi:hypothetical protein